MHQHQKLRDAGIIQFIKFKLFVVPTGLRRAFSVNPNHAAVVFFPGGLIICRSSEFDHANAGGGAPAAPSCRGQSAVEAAATTPATPATAPPPASPSDNFGDGHFLRTGSSTFGHG